MWGLSKQQKYWLWQGHTDMRSGFDSLAGLVRCHLWGHNPLSGDAYIFINRRRTQVKILVWETGGFLIYYKRLEQGTIELPDLQADGSLRLDELIHLVDGVKLKSIQRRKRFDIGHGSR
jgi:transposase